MSKSFVGIYTKRVALAAAIGAVALGGVASAQRLEEVIVTSTKRAENLQDVPVSIGVVSGELINNFDVKDVGDLQSFVPGLQVQKTFGSWAVRVRGIGSGISNLAFDSSVPAYLDGVYCGRGKCLEGAFMDVDRVEVARGPQGALFGKSTIAGAISIISAKPTDELEGYIKGSYEMVDGGYTITGAVSGPLSDTVRGRVAVKTEDLDGWVDNTWTGADDGGSEADAIRLSLAWDATDQTTFNLKLETGETSSEGRNNQLVNPGIMGGVNSDPNPEYVADDVRRVSTGSGQEDFAEYEWTSATLTMDMEIAEHTLTAITNYWEYDSAWYLDVDGTPDLILNSHLEDEYNQTSFELRLLSPTDQKLEYIVGAWYQKSDLRTDQYATYGPLFWDAVGVPGFVPRPADNSGTHRKFNRDTDAYSVYGQLTWNMTDDFRAIVDLRYTEEDQDATGSSNNVTFPNNYDPVYLAGPILGGKTEYLFLQNRTDDNVDPSIRFQYDLNEDVVLYTGYSRGSKAGGMKANDSDLGDYLLAANPSANPINFTLEQGNGLFDFEGEEADSYELGLKSTLMDGAATLNVALFVMDFKDLQTSNYDGNNFIIGNAGAAEIEGIEIEGSLQASENLRLNATLSYVDATYSDYEGAQCVENSDGSPANSDCVGGTENQKGEKLERSPDLEANVNANWESELTANTRLNVTLAMYHSGEYFVQPTQAEYATQGSYTKWDARVAIVSSDDKWEVALNGRNLTDELVIQHAYQIVNAQFNSLSRGRTVSLEGTWRF